MHGAFQQPLALQLPALQQEGEGEGSGKAVCAKTRGKAPTHGQSPGGAQSHPSPFQPGQTPGRDRRLLSQP